MKNLLIIAVAVFTLSSCVKNQELVPLSGTAVNVSNPAQTFEVSGQKLVSQGNFMSNVHTVSGTAKLYEKDGKRTLVFNNFNTDAGPDLRIYLSEDKGASKFTELSKLGNTGNFFVEVPAAVNPDKQKFVLIYCKRFSVLFGNAELK